MIKSETVASVIGVSGTDQVGLTLGIADGDLTLPEIEASIELTGPLGPNDTVSEAVADRPVWFLGAVMGNPTGSVVMFTNNEGGYMLDKVVRWTFARTKGWNYFVYNMGEAPTTGATLVFRAKQFGVWVT